MRLLCGSRSALTHVTQRDDRPGDAGDAKQAIDEPELYKMNYIKSKRYVTDTMVRNSYRGSSKQSSTNDTESTTT